ncbi:MAG: hypothetical protein CVV27_15005 [Candidatus Melainabacteria bacterium HGW-Melainabacteria-1]|nr:MAG: hypothetical protein CVV27_15005 [Candidatus Melainabacteria bacterium HGW-Melainabacteria-1]
MQILVHILSGLLLGYLLLCISESASHRNFLHASPRIRKFWQRIGLIGRYIHNSWYSHHVVHHYRTYRQNHVTQFRNQDEAAALEADLIRRGKQQIALNSYGLRVGSLKEFIKYVYPHVPHYALLCYLGGPWFTLGALLPVLFYQWLAHYVHPYLHMNYAQALNTASPLMRPFLRSRYFRFLAQHHYLHHKYVHCNYNLLLGGDLVWRRQRFPSPQDYADMQALGLFVAARHKAGTELNLAQSR